MQRYRVFIVPLLLLVVTAAVFGEVRNHDFVKWDDNVNIYENPHFNPATPDSILQFWTTRYDATYRPLAQTFWGLVATMAQMPEPVNTAELGTNGLNPAPFHLFNLLLHLLNVLLVFAILRRLVKNEGAAGAGALLFGVHPLQVETVAWVTGMNDALYTCFGLLALWQYMRFSQPAKKEEEMAPEGPPVETPAQRDAAEQADLANATGKTAWGTYALATVFFLAALLSKPSAVAIPFVALAFDYCLLKPPKRQSTVALGGWLLLALVCTLITRDAHTITNPATIPPLYLRPLIAGDALAFYLYKLVWPVDLAIDYGRNPGYVLATKQAHWTWIIPVGLGLLLWLGRKRWPVPAVAGLVSVVALLPVLGLVPFGFQQYSTVADRYFYFAMLGPALALAWVLSQNRFRVLPVAGAVVLVLLCILTPKQVLTWRSTSSLFQHELEVNPNSYYAHLSLGEVANANGDLDLAVRHYSDALRINPNSWVSHGQLGFVLYRLGDHAGAIEEWKAAVKLDPTYEPARKALELIQREQKKAMSHEP